MDNLKNIWEKKTIPLPGTVEDFVDYLGVSSVRKLESMNFSQLEKLPNVVGYGLISCGGSYDRVEEEFHWTWHASREQVGMTDFIGKGKSYDEAAVKGLLVYWELVTLRKNI